MAEAASEWDGRVLVRPNVVYDSVWDANILHGCVCDPGWIGHDCSQLECPRGDDPFTAVRSPVFPVVLAFQSQRASRTFAEKQSRHGSKGSHMYVRTSFTPKASPV